jgi:hypothetical protein
MAHARLLLLLTTFLLAMNVAVPPLAEGAAVAAMVSLSPWMNA